jgi:hypothetical protein
VRELAGSLTDKLYGDRGYLSKALEADLLDKGVSLVTTVRKNIKAKLYRFGIGPCFQGAI